MKAGLASRRSGATFYSFSMGMSPEALNIQDQETIIRDGRDLSNSMDNIDVKLLILSIYDCCCKDNWDGYGAKAVTPASWRGALKLISSLPTGFAKPEVTASPRGLIVVEWYKRKGYIVSVTVENDSKLSYNALFGPDEAYGVVAFERDLPDAILRNLSQLFNI
jgi:hypothetical protein